MRNRDETRPLRERSAAASCSHVCIHSRQAAPADIYICIYISHVSQVLIPSRVTRRMSGIPFRAPSSAPRERVLFSVFSPSPPPPCTRIPRRGGKMNARSTSLSREKPCQPRARHSIRDLLPVSASSRKRGRRAIEKSLISALRLSRWITRRSSSRVQFIPGLFHGLCFPTLQTSLGGSVQKIHIRS